MSGHVVDLPIHDTTGRDTSSILDRWNVSLIVLRSGTSLLRLVQLNEVRDGLYPESNGESSLRLPRGVRRVQSVTSCTPRDDVCQRRDSIGYLHDGCGYVVMSIDDARDCFHIRIVDRLLTLEVLLYQLDRSINVFD